MAFFRNSKSYFIKIMTGYGFYVCIIFTAVLCFSAEIYEDFGNGNKYSAFRALMEFDRDFMLGDTAFCSLEVMKKGAGSWISLFIPIVSSFSFVQLICDEYDSKAVRFEIFRSSRLCFHSSKFIVSCLSGGLAVMLGFGLFTIASYMLFPDISGYETDMRNMYMETLTNQQSITLERVTARLIAQKSASMFMYGAVCSVPAMLLTAIVRNKYLVLCIPFFIKYAVNQTLIKLQTQAAADYENMDVELLRAAGIVNPDALSRLNQYGNDKKYVLIYSFIITIIAFIIYLIAALRKEDSGE